jgi:acyl carrier protein
MTILERVYSVIRRQLALEPDYELTQQTKLRSQLGADSLDYVELAMSLEQEFDVYIPDDKVEDIETISDIVEVITGCVYAS